MKTKQAILAIVILLIVIFSITLYLNNGGGQIIGGDRDEHGCLIAAGYRWCPSEQECMRMWEEYCEEYSDQFRIDSFEDCVAAGFPVMESYPRQCRDSEGNLFVEEIEERVFCTPGQRNVDACIEIYQPVCGWNDPEKIQCITFPCASTYSNNVLYYTGGECPE
jgi:hypothetical protein